MILTTIIIVTISSYYYYYYYYSSLGLLLLYCFVSITTIITRILRVVIAILLHRRAGVDGSQGRGARSRHPPSAGQRLLGLLRTYEL